MDIQNNPLISQNQPAKINWRQFGKHWVAVFVLAVVAGFTIWGLLSLGPWLRNLQDQRVAQTLKDQLARQLSNDKYGGKTPQGTFDLLISALEKGDVDLASRYFILTKQDQWRMALEEYKSKSLINNIVVELKKTRDNLQEVKSNDPNMAEFNFPIVIPQNKNITDDNGQITSIKAGKYVGDLKFFKYPSGNWKLDTL